MLTRTYLHRNRIQLKYKNFATELIDRTVRSDATKTTFVIKNIGVLIKSTLFGIDAKIEKVIEYAFHFSNISRPLRCENANPTSFVNILSRVSLFRTQMCHILFVVIFHLFNNVLVTSMIFFFFFKRLSPIYGTWIFVDIWIKAKVTAF